MCNTCVKMVEGVPTKILGKATLRHSTFIYYPLSITWPASMLIYWNKRKHLHEKRVQVPEDFLGTPTWPPFHCFGTPIWSP